MPNNVTVMNPNDCDVFVNTMAKNACDSAYNHMDFFFARILDAARYLSAGVIHHYDFADVNFSQAGNKLYVLLNTPANILFKLSSQSAVCAICHEPCDTVYPCESLKHGYCVPCNISSRKKLLYMEFLKNEESHAIHRDRLSDEYSASFKRFASDETQKYINALEKCPICTQPAATFHIDDDYIRLRCLLFAWCSKLCDHNLSYADFCSKIDPFLPRRKRKLCSNV